MNTHADNIIPIQNNQQPQPNANIQGQPITSGHSAKVSQIVDGQITVELEGQQINAQIAFSSFAQPQINDVVLLNFDQHQQAYITAILKREQADEMTMQLPAKTIINSSEKITLSSQEIAQMAQKQVSKATEQVMEFDLAVVKGNQLHSHVRHLHSISDMVTTMAKQAIQKFSSYVRKSDVSDQVQAAQMSRKVEGLYSMNSKHTILVSQKDTKIDGEHIHMG